MPVQSKAMPPVYHQWLALEAGMIAGISGHNTSPTSPPTALTAPLGSHDHMLL